MRRKTLAYAALLALFTLPSAATDPAPGAPLDIGLEERVEVQLVLIDAIVVDRGDRTVADLEASDFDLLIDDRHVPIDTFDARCSAGSQADPPVGATRTVFDGESAPTRRYVFVVDYFHLGREPIELLGDVREAILRLGAPGEEYMLMSLGQVLRIEVPFTSEVEPMLTALDRMILDRELYFGHYDRLTERRWYNRLLTLLDLMERVPGQKAIVLFSGPLLADGWRYDSTFNEIAAMASRSRSSFYPVDTRGLTPFDDAMGPPQLRRLALETGGRPTAGTNDMARAFARAQRDLGCQYTIGFYDSEPRFDRERKVRLFVRQHGYRVVHPNYYVVRSLEEKRRSLTDTAARVPAMFSGEGITATVSLDRPLPTGRWAVVAGVSLDPSLYVAAPAGTSWTVRVQLRKLSGTLHRGLQQEREIPLPPAGGAEPLLLEERFEPLPGDYELQVIVSGPALSEPLATSVAVHVPPTPG